METKIMRVVQQGDVLTVQSPKSEGGMLKKRNIILREMGENTKTPMQRSCSELQQN